jgi:cation-transporting P-type ATPase E
VTTTDGIRGPAPTSGAALPRRSRTPAEGLRPAAVVERVAAGQTYATSARTSRTLLEIVRANVFTFFNAAASAWAS